MKNELSEEQKILASYSTYKALFEDHKTTYDIVAAFIKASITDCHRGTVFSSESLQSIIKNEFGIVIPSAVISVAAKKVSYLKKVDSSSFELDSEKVQIENEFFDKQRLSVQTAQTVLEQLKGYLDDLGCSLSEKEISQAFMNYLLDESVVEDSLKKHFSTFIIKNSLNREFINAVNNIKRGHCLLVGLENNSTVDLCNTWNGTLTIYLDMEILFHLVGYNGHLFESIAKDFIYVVKQANKSHGSINLKFFNSTKREIEDYFYSVKMRLNSVDASMPMKNAMKHLLKLCKCKSDVEEEMQLFFAKLSRLGVHEDTREEYKNSKYDIYNLESIELLEKYTNEESNKNPEKTQEKIQNRLNAISNINRLRKGEIFYDYRNCGYIFVTGTNQTLKISHDLLSEEVRSKGESSQSNMEKYNSDNAIEYAVSLFRITNALWYRLNNTLLTGSPQYPIETDALVRARIIVSSLLDRKIETFYESARYKILSGEWTKDEALQRLVSVIKIQHEPEEITADTIDADVTILSMDDIEAVKNETEFLQNENHEKDLEINKLKDEKDFISKENNDLKLYKEINETQKLITQYDEIIRKYNIASCIITIHTILINGGIVVGCVLLFFAIIKVISVCYWDTIEPIITALTIGYALIQFVIQLIFGKRICSKGIIKRLLRCINGKYLEDYNVDIEDIKAKRESLIIQLSRLNS